MCPVVDAQLLHGVGRGGGAQEDAEPEATETLQIARSMMGKIIGKQGARINLIRNSSKCAINIEQDGVQGDAESSIAYVPEIKGGLGIFSLRRK